MNSASDASLARVAGHAHLQLLLSVRQVLCGVAVVQWGPHSVQDFFFTLVQGFIDLV